MVFTSLQDLLIGRVALHQKVIEGSNLRNWLQQIQGSSKPLGEGVVHQNLISPTDWQKCLQTASQQPTWPEHPQMIGRESQFLFQRLQTSQSIPQVVLQRAYHLTQQSLSSERPLSFLQALIQTGQVSESHLSQVLGILRQHSMSCPQCQMTYTVGPFHRWYQYPCLFCPTYLQSQRTNQTQDMATTGDPSSTRTGDGQDMASTLALHEAMGEQDNSDPSVTQVNQTHDEAGGKRIFGRYQIQKKLGEGGMGAVYLALDSQLERKVALKVITGGGQNEEVYQRFRREAKLASNLRHPGIIPLYDFGIEDNTPYFTMGFVEGRDLRGLVEEKKKLSVPKALTLAVKITEAVAYAHERKVIHRDIKPDNVMIDEGGRPLLMDFGLAKEVEGKKTQLTQDGAIVGSPEFMAPEQAYGERDVGFGADIYAIGGVLFYMLAGRPPFSGKEVMDLLFQVVHNPPPSLKSINLRVKKDLDTVVQKCLAKNPQHRYESAEALLDDLRALREGRPISARPPTIFQRLIWWAKVNPLPSIGALLALAVAISIGLGVYLAGGKDPEKLPTEKDKGQLTKDKSKSPPPKVDVAREVEKVVKRIESLEPPLEIDGRRDFVRSLRSHPRDEVLPILLKYTRGRSFPVIEVMWKAILPWKKHLSAEIKSKRLQSIKSKLTDFPFGKRPHEGLFYIQVWEEVQGKTLDSRKARVRGADEFVRKFNQEYLKPRQGVGRIGHEKALRYAQWAIDFADQGRPHYMKAQVYLKMGNQPDKALASLTEAAKRNPYYPAAYQQLARLHFNRREYERAVHYINWAITCQPEVARLYAARAQYSIWAGQHVAAIIDLKSLAKKYPQKFGDEYGPTLKNIMKTSSTASRKWTKFTQQHQRFVQLVRENKVESFLTALQLAQKDSNLAWIACSIFHRYLGKGTEALQREIRKTFVVAGGFGLPFLLHAFSPQTDDPTLKDALKVVLDLEMTARPLLEYIYKIKGRSEEIQKLVLTLSIRLRQLEREKKSVPTWALEQKELYSRQVALSELKRFHRRGDFYPDVVALALRDKNSDIRRQAAVLLGQMGAKARSVLSQLEGSLKNEDDSEVKNALGNAIMKIKKS